MDPFPPTGPTKKGAGLPISRRPPDPLSSLFRTEGRSPGARQPRERGARVADVKRGLFFAAILVFVAIVLYQFVMAL